MGCVVLCVYGEQAEKTLLMHVGCQPMKGPKRDTVGLGHTFIISRCKKNEDSFCEDIYSIIPET